MAAAAASLAQSAPSIQGEGKGRVYSKSFGVFKSKRIYRVGDDAFFCERHDSRLGFNKGQNGYGHGCDFCGVKFAKLPEAQQVYYECRACNLDFCPDCLKNPANFK